MLQRLLQEGERSGQSWMHRKIEEELNPFQNIKLVSIGTQIIFVSS